MTELASFAWQATELPEALARLAARMGARIPPGGRRLFETTAADVGQPRSGAWLPRVGAGYGLELEEVSVVYGDLAELVRGGPPAILRLPPDDGFLVLFDRRGARVRILAGDGTLRAVAVERLVAAISVEIEERHRPDTERILGRLGTPTRRHTERLRAALLRELAHRERITAGWLVRLQPGASFWAQARQAGALRFLSASLATHVLYYVLWLTSWWLVGRGVLSGRIEAGWLIAWALLLATLVPLRTLVLWCQGRFSIASAAILRARLLDGALRLAPDDVRHQGVGQLLGRVLESEAVEALALSGGLAASTATLELAMAALVLSSGSASGVHLLSLLAVLVVTGFVTAGYYRARSRWTTSRLAVTHDLVERLVGHRTVVVQQAPELLHRDEDRALEEYLGRSRSIDRARAWLAIVPGAWLVIGLATLLPVLVGGDQPRARLAVTLGGLLLVHRALSTLVVGLTQLSAAHIGWRRIASIFRAAEGRGRPSTIAARLAETAAETPASGGAILTARHLSYRFASRSQTAVDRCSLEIRTGERWLVEGPSGGGKSTLAALLAGLRLPTSGLLLIAGQDCRYLPAEVWRRLVAAVPQFHENHVVSETFAFNVLMGGRWPPQGRELPEAEQVCRDLGLGELIDTMPGGMLQRVGEAGWKLSHGERSRLFIARALLQEPQLLIVDEGFAALDPESLRRAMTCVLKRARSLLVIAHP